MVKYAKLFTCGDVEIGHVLSSPKIKDVLGDDINIAEKNHSDLITGKYEGEHFICMCVFFKNLNYKFKFSYKFINFFLK